MFSHSNNNPSGFSCTQGWITPASLTTAGGWPAGGPWVFTAGQRRPWARLQDEGGPRWCSSRVGGHKTATQLLRRGRGCGRDKGSLESRQRCGELLNINDVEFRPRPTGVHCLRDTMPAQRLLMSISRSRAGNREKHSGLVLVARCKVQCVFTQ